MGLLETTTAEGALKGMILARAPHELDDQEVAYLQDAIINQPGFVNRRGAITGTTAITAANIDSTRPAAVCSVFDPQGIQKIGVVYVKDTGAAYEIWLAVFTTALAFVQKHFLMVSNFGAGLYPGRTAMIQCTPAMDGSVIITLRHSYGRALISPGFPTAQLRVLKWYGGCPSTTIASGASPTATVAATEGSTAVTGLAAEIAKISFPGTVIAGTGVVASVTSTVQVELMLPSPKTYAATATGFFIGENFTIARARGAVSCAAGVLTGITGYGTKFTEARDRATVTPGSGFDIFDATTMKLLASLNTNIIPFVSDTVTGVPTSVTRSAALKNYLMFSNSGLADIYFNRFTAPPTLNTATPKATKGSWWANYKGYMISFNGLVEVTAGVDSGDVNTTSRGYVHGPRFPEIMDHSVADGDWFDVVSTKGGDADGIACVGGANSVVLCKSQETFALTGSNPDDFTLNKIVDDGALSYEAVTSWKGAPIWLGRTGIWMYDSVNPAENIVETTLGPRWKELVASYATDVASGSNAQDSDNYPLNQARCFVYKDYLFVNVTNTGSVHSVYTDGVARTANTMQLMIYLPTRAVSYLTNFNFQAFIQIGKQGYVILPQLGSTTHHWFPLDNLFTQGAATVDTILTANSYNSGSVPTSVGPWFHMESRKFSVGDGLRRKTWKQLAIESLMTSTKRIFLETVSGLNTVGVRQTLPYVGTGLFVAVKNKFNARDQYMSFRLYEDINNRPATLKLGAWQWGYKLARRGQV